MYEVTKKFNLSKSRCLVSFFCFLGESQHKQKGTVEFSKDNPSKSSEWHQRETAILEMIFPSDIL